MQTPLNPQGWTNQLLKHQWEEYMKTLKTALVAGMAGAAVADLPKKTTWTAYGTT